MTRRWLLDLAVWVDEKLLERLGQQDYRKWHHVMEANVSHI